jgi:cysteine desulfurase
VKKQVIYLDNNATTQIDERVLDAMMPFLTNQFANANSTHLFGIHAYEAIKSARFQVSELIGADANEIVFTSGSTEAINLAIKGVAENYQSKGMHIVTVLKSLTCL